jgi:hypothetical protein
MTWTWTVTGRAVKPGLSVPMLLPEEDAIGDPGDEDEDQDDTLPADLWYRAVSRQPSDSP